MRILITAIIIAIGFTGCFESDARVASKNLSKASDMFEVDRRIIFYNGISGEYMLNIEGKCSIEPSDSKLSVTCKVGDGKFKKHYLGLSNNVTYFVEQLESKGVSVNHYRVIFKPQSILPDIDFRGNLTDIPKTDGND